jgi:hypothetical protein
MISCAKVGGNVMAATRKLGCVIPFKATLVAFISSKDMLIFPIILILSLRLSPQTEKLLRHIAESILLLSNHLNTLLVDLRMKCQLLLKL